MSDKRFRISADRLERMAFDHPLATVEIDNEASIAYLHGYPVPFWAELEPVSV